MTHRFPSFSLYQPFFGLFSSVLFVFPRLIASTLAASRSRLGAGGRLLDEVLFLPLLPLLLPKFAKGEPNNLPVTIPLLLCRHPLFLNAVGQSLPPDPLTKIHVKNSIYSSGLQAPTLTFQKHIFQPNILSLLKFKGGWSRTWSTQIKSRAKCS